MSVEVLNMKAGKTHVSNKCSPKRNQIALGLCCIFTGFGAVPTSGDDRSWGPNVSYKVVALIEGNDVSVFHTINARFDEVNIREGRMEVADTSHNVGKLW